MSIPIHRLVPAGLRAKAKEWLDEREVSDRHVRSIDALKRVAARISESCLTQVRTLADWESEKPALRRQLLWMLGLHSPPERTPLQAQITGTLDRPAYRMEKVVFQSLPGLYVTGNFYLPKSCSTPPPCVVYLCGHMPHPRGAKTQYQDRYLWYPAHGFACLVLDPLEFGEVRGIHHGTHDLNLWHWLSLGYTPAGVEVWNAMRAIDWLETRPEVDARRIGVTGISGGGVMTCYLAATDERVSAAAPSCSVYTIGSQAAGWLVNGQCDCTFYPNVYMLDFPVVAALIAPRPLLITAGRKDRLFPPAGYTEVFRRAKRIYDLYEGPGKLSERIRLVDADVGHMDAPLFLREARKWMRRWLRNESGQSSNADLDHCIPVEPEENIAVLDAAPARAVNYSIQDSFIRTPSPGLPELINSWRHRRKQLLGELREKTFRWFPESSQPFMTRTRQKKRPAYAATYSRVTEHFFDTEPGVPVRVVRLAPADHSARSPLVIVVKQAGDSVHFPDIDYLLPLMGRTRVMILYPRFTEKTVRPREFAGIERTAAITGRSIAALQVWDVVRTVHWALEFEPLAPAEIVLFGRQNAGVVALYAALFEERINHLILADPPSSHREGPALPAVLRTADLPETAGALAPRRLTMLGGPEEAYRFTESIYALCGAQGSFRRAASLAEAVLEG